MSAPPYMKLFPADFIADTLHLNRAQVGAYWLLLMAMWRAGGKLPANDAKLAQIARCSAKEWAADRETLLALFQRRGGRLTHKRLAAEMAKAESISDVRKEASERGVSEKRKKNSAKAQPNGEPNANQLVPYIRVSESIPPNPPLRGDEQPARFSEGWLAYPIRGRGNRGPAKAQAQWPGAVERAGGEARLLAAIQAHARQLAADPKQTPKAFDRWLRDDGFAAYLTTDKPTAKAKRWQGPPEIWQAVADAKSPAWANTWLADCAFQAQPPTLVSPSATTVSRLRLEVGDVLAQRGIQLLEATA